MKLIAIFCGLIFICSCGRDEQKKEEQLTLDEYSRDADKDSATGLQASIGFKQLTSSANSVLLTGMDRYRLLPIYKLKPKADRNLDYYNDSSYEYDYEAESAGEDSFRYFMPGMDIIHGYNLINVGHYDMQHGKLSYFFSKPVLVRTLYFPGVKRDSINKLPVSRNFFLASVYDEDTNRDSLINKRDLRHFYHFDEANSTKTAILPPTHSAIRSTYDYKNDVMYIHARFDSNKNGIPERNEPINIFWISLKSPGPAKKFY